MHGSGSGNLTEQSSLVRLRVSRVAPYITIVVVFLLSRLLFSGLGVAFSYEPLLHGLWQIMDVALLRDQPLQTLWYMHAQPPLFNALIALALQLSGDNPDAAFASIYSGLTLAGLFGFYSVAMDLLKRKWIALGVTLVVATSSATILYERALMYEGLVTWLLALGFACLWQHLVYGLTVVLLAVIGAWSTLGTPPNADARRLTIAILPCLVMCFFLYNSVVRDVIFMLFFLCILAAFGMQWLLVSPGLESRLATVAFALVLADLGSTSVQVVSRTDKAFELDAGAYLEKVAPDQRVAEVGVAANGSIRANIGPNSSPFSYYSVVQRVDGHQGMTATLVHNYAETIVKMAESDLKSDARLSELSNTLLGMLNVTRVICLQPRRMGCPARLLDAMPEGPLGAVVPVPDATPVLFSTRLVLLQHPPGAAAAAARHRQAHVLGRGLRIETSEPAGRRNRRLSGQVRQESRHLSAGADRRRLSGPEPAARNQPVRERSADARTPDALRRFAHRRRHDDRGGQCRLCPTRSSVLPGPRRHHQRAGSLAAGRQP